MNDAGIVRNRLKVEGSALNARAYLAILDEGRTFDDFLWQFNRSQDSPRPEATKTSLPNNQRNPTRCPGTAAARIQVRRIHHLLRFMQAVAGDIMSKVVGKPEEKVECFDNRPSSRHVHLTTRRVGKIRQGGHTLCA